MSDNRAGWAKRISQPPAKRLSDEDFWFAVKAIAAVIDRTDAEKAERDALRRPTVHVAPPPGMQLPSSNARAKSRWGRTTDW